MCDETSEHSENPGSIQQIASPGVLHHRCFSILPSCHLCPGSNALPHHGRTVLLRQKGGDARHRWYSSSSMSTCLELPVRALLGRTPVELNLFCHATDGLVDAETFEKQGDSESSVEMGGWQQWRSSFNKLIWIPKSGRRHCRMKMQESTEFQSTKPEEPQIQADT
jgi:hypothetical protein